MEKKSEEEAKKRQRIGIDEEVILVGKAGFEIPMGVLNRPMPSC
jgi:hypothetical protein